MSLNLQQGFGLPGAFDAATAVSKATELLQRAHSVSTPELVVAVSCLANLAASESGASNPTSVPGPNAARHPSWHEDGRSMLFPRPPSVLPLLPLLAAIAARDQAMVEAALRRLNRRLACPLSCAADLTMRPDPRGVGVLPLAGRRPAGSNRMEDSDGGGSTGISSEGVPSARASLAHSNSSSIGIGSSAGRLTAAALSSSFPDCSSSRGSQSGRSAATSAAPSLYAPSAVSSLVAARQAEAQMVNENEGCRAAAARLCGRSAQLYSSNPAATALAFARVVHGVETEGEAVRGACVAALAALAADVRCHQTLLGSAALDALRALLRSPVTAPYAAVLVHNLAAPPSASFREQLRRRGVLLPLLEHVARLAAADQPLDLPRELREFAPPPAPAPLPSPARGPGPDLSSLALVLTTLACLSAGQEGAEALRQPQLRAHKRLLALRARLSSWDETSSGHDGTTPVLHLRSNPRRPQQHDPLGGLSAGRGGPAGADAASVSQWGAVSLATLESMVRQLLRVVAKPGVGREAGPVAVASGPNVGGPAGAMVMHPWRTPVDAPAYPAAAGHQKVDQQQHTVAPRAAVGHPAAEMGARSAGDPPATPPFGAADNGTSVAFHSEVVVDGRPLQLTSIITRTIARRPDGSEDVQYHFQDQVFPGPDPAVAALPGARTPAAAAPMGCFTHTPMSTVNPLLTPPGSAPPRTAACYTSSSTWLHSGLPGSTAMAAATAAAVGAAAIPPVAATKATPKGAEGGALDACQPPDQDRGLYRDQQLRSGAAYPERAHVMYGGKGPAGHHVGTSPDCLPRQETTPVAASERHAAGHSGQRPSADPLPRTAPTGLSPLAVLAKHAGWYLSSTGDRRRDEEAGRTRELTGRR